MSISRPVVLLFILALIAVRREPKKRSWKMQHLIGIRADRMFGWIWFWSDTRLYYRVTGSAVLKASLFFSEYMLSCYGSLSVLLENLKNVT